MREKECRFLTIVLSAALVLIILPVIVSAENNDPSATVYAMNNGAKPDSNEAAIYDNSKSDGPKHGLNPQNAPFLRRAWETFDDNELVPEPPPTGFVLESALGLGFPSSSI